MAAIENMPPYVQLAETDKLRTKYGDLGSSETRILKKSITWLSLAGLFLVALFLPWDKIGPWLFNETGQCSDGLIISGPAKNGANIFIWLLFLCWTFLGVAVAADIFMVSIEVITSQKTMKSVLVNGELKHFKVLIWNGTVANLTLMALGSSAPEILLSCIEIISSGFYAGELGPGTIVGSAAFNLLGITAVCILAIPAGQGRKIKELGVFGCTAFFSIFAYLWLGFILLVSSPNLIEPWEGILTFLFFPALVILSYTLDVGILTCSPKGNRDKAIVGFSADGRPLSKDSIAKTIALHYGSDKAPNRDALLETLLDKPKSRGYYRINATRAGMGGKVKEKKSNILGFLSSHTRLPPAVIAFENSAVVCNEGQKKVSLTVLRKGNATKKVWCMYKTVSITAKAGEDFVFKSEQLVFDKGQMTATIEVEVLDDDIEEDTETFQVVLETPSNGCEIGGAHSCEVTILDDDSVGTLSFAIQQVSVLESAKRATLEVVRTNGSKGTLSCKWKTEDGEGKNAAYATTDYVAGQGELTFASGVTKKVIEVEIIDDAVYESNQQFEVTLFDLTDGVAFADGRDEVSATVSIIDDDERKDLVDEVTAALNLDFDYMHLAAASWSEQFHEAVTYTPGGGFVGALLYLFSLPWKIIFAFVPPARLWGGWPCFLITLAGIGMLTALVGDLADQMGCCMGLKPAITAITFVAMGTSLPDTFASMASCRQEPFADNSVGNITGSNSVNVFLGLGLPWAIAAIYWVVYGGVNEAEWRARYQNEPWYYPGIPVGFAVPAGDLGFSVIVFCTCGTITLGFICLRRALLGFELGGPQGPKIASGVFLFGLWLVYIFASTGNAYKWF